MAKGKTSSGKKYVSKGLHKARKIKVQRHPLDRAIAQLEAHEKGKNVRVAVPVRPDDATGENRDKQWVKMSGKEAYGFQTQPFTMKN